MDGRGECGGAAWPHWKCYRHPRGPSLKLVFILPQALLLVARSSTRWHLMPRWDLWSGVQSQCPQEGLPGSGWGLLGAWNMGAEPRACPGS